MSEFGGAKINTRFLIFLKKDFVMELVSAEYNVRVNLSTDYKLKREFKRNILLKILDIYFQGLKEISEDKLAENVRSWEKFA